MARTNAGTMVAKKSYAGGTGAQIKSPVDLFHTQEALNLLADVEVLVGFPEETADRPNDTGETTAYGVAITSGKSEVTNASLAYIHDNGAPERNIPARPFMIPAINEVQARISAKLGQIARAIVGKPGGTLIVEQGMHQIGLIGQLAIQNKINEGIPPPLSDATLRARARKGRKGAGIELLSRSQGIAPSMDFAKPLVDTGEFRKSASYAIRSRKKRK